MARKVALRNSMSDPMPVQSGTSSVASILPSLGKPLVPQVLSETRAIGGKGICYVSIGHRTYLSFLSYLPYCDPIPLSYADYIGLPRLCFLSLITPIVNHLLYYLVAVCLLPYQCLACYLVQYLNRQSGGTVSLGLCPLCLLTLTCLESSSSV